MWFGGKFESSLTSLSVMTTGARKLQELATQKEQELHKIREEHYHALETSLKSCEEELEREKEKRKALEDDFRYNLTLIEQRDHELARYDTIFQELKKVFTLPIDIILVSITCPTGCQ